MHALAQQAGLVRVAHRYDDLGRSHCVGEREGAGDGSDRTVEPELSQQSQPVDGRSRKRAVGHQHPDSDRQIQRGSLFSEARRRQIHRDPPQRPCQAAAQDSGPNPVAGLSTRRVG